ncbi:MAG: alpha/beta hydrolase [Flavobacteriaceae bacterium]|nr:MAG: alpha/beta hydrolase [Flavobacteriaceae bacterium]
MGSKRHIYLMPGLAASPKIFEYIQLDPLKTELHYLEWIPPVHIKESVEEYAQKYIELIRHPEPILIGVSFGGILVQEISRIIKVRKVIIISSIKSKNEMPKRLRFLKSSGVYKLFPSKRLSKIDDFTKFDYHPHLKKKGELYNKYLGVRNEKYLNWSLRAVLHWENKSSVTDLVHIHGTKDEIFPIKHIEDCIPVEGGTHAMILIKAKIINQILNRLLLQ